MGWLPSFAGALVVLSLVSCKRGPKGEDAVLACKQGGNAQACSNACDYLYGEKRYPDMNDMRRAQPELRAVCDVSCRTTGAADHCRRAVP